MQNGLIKHTKAKFEKNRLIIDDSITIDEWKKLGMGLRQVEGSVQFWIGDWAGCGEKKGFTGKYVNGAVYDELEELTGLKRDSLKKMKRVSEKVSPATRFAELSFSHHEEVAALPVEDQKELLMLASKEKLSKRQLRDKVKTRKNGTDLDKLADSGDLTLSGLLTAPTVMTKKEAVVAEWIDKNPGKYDDIDKDILSKILPMLKNMVKKYGPIAITQTEELVRMIKSKDL